MSKVSPHSITTGPFAESRQNIDAFCHNLFLAAAMDQCSRRFQIVQEEYEQAVEAKDDVLAQQKRTEMEVYQSSLQLTAHIFAEVDDIEV
jgi:hypothetical protein